MDRDDKLITHPMKTLSERIDLSKRDSWALICAKIDEGASVHAQRLERGDASAAEFYVSFGSADPEPWSKLDPLLLRDWQSVLGGSKVNGVCSGFGSNFGRVREYALSAHGLNIVAATSNGPSRWIKLSVHEAPWFEKMCL